MRNVLIGCGCWMICCTFIGLLLAQIGALAKMSNIARLEENDAASGRAISMRLLSMAFAGAFAATILAGGVLFYALSSSRGPDILGARHICSVFGISIP